MSVTLSSALPAFNFSRNPIPVTLESSDVIATAGVTAVVHINFTGVINAGDTIRLTWSARDLVMTASNLVDSSGKQFSAGDGSPAHVASVVNDFRRNPYIKKYYQVNSIGSLLLLTARKNGTEENMTPVTTGHLALTMAAMGVNELLKPNFKHYLNVFLAGQQIYSQPLALDYPAADGITTKDLSDILDNYLGSDSPSLAAAGWTLCENSFKEFNIEYAQYYGDIPEIAALHETDISYVNRGALDISTFAGKTLKSFLIPGDIPSKILCLRQGSKMNLVQTDQPEWLYWINLSGADVNIKLRVEINFSDGSAPFVYYRFPFTASANCKYYAPVSYQVLDVKANTTSGKFATSYSVRICDAAGNFLSANYTYVIDQYREWPHYFVYLNSLGGYQTLYTWGRSEDSIDRSKEDLEFQVTDEQAALIGRKQERNIRIQDKLLVNTGYRTAREVNLLKDFMASEEKYLVKNGNLVPIGVSNTSLPLNKDGETLSAAQFECYPQYDNWAFTDDPTQVDSTISNGSGSGVGKGYNAIVDDGNNTDSIYYDDL